MFNETNSFIAAMWTARTENAEQPCDVPKRRMMEDLWHVDAPFDRYGDTPGMRGSLPTRNRYDVPESLESRFLPPARFVVPLTNAAPIGVTAVEDEEDMRWDYGDGDDDMGGQAAASAAAAAASSARPTTVVDMRVPIGIISDDVF